MQTDSAPRLRELSTSAGTQLGLRELSHIFAWNRIGGPVAGPPQDRKFAGDGVTASCCRFGLAGSGPASARGFGAATVIGDAYAYREPSDPDRYEQGKVLPRHPIKPPYGKADVPAKRLEHGCAV
ncbi:MAG: hypothetical protein ABSG93_13665 [Solirubrobacteraceae bacterium]